MFSVQAAAQGTPVSMTVLVALLVCLIPTTIGGLLSAIGIAGMSRMMQANVIATSGRAVEAAGDVDVLLLDKTGTITLGNRQASAFLPAPGRDGGRTGRCAQLASLADETPEGPQHRRAGQAEVQPARARHGGLGATFVPFTAQTRMSGVDLEWARDPQGRGRRHRKHVEALGGSLSREVQSRGRRSGAPRQHAAGGGRRRAVLGVVELKDIVKGGIKERFAELRRMGIKTVMITGDNRSPPPPSPPRPASTTSWPRPRPSQAALIREYQAEGPAGGDDRRRHQRRPGAGPGRRGVAMNTGTQAAKEAGNMVDLDSNPTKLIEIVETGKQMLMTRGSLTTFSIANDVAKYFAIIPAAFVGTYPQLAALNVMGLASPPRPSCRR
jgi:K+-transporting ATPase ATPase B chain